MPAEGLYGRTVGVDRLQPGDHAFWSYADDEAHWDTLSLFTQQGLARGEKVMLLVDIAHEPGWVAARVAGGAEGAQRAVRAGQLVVSNAPRFPRGEFDAGRLVEGVRRRIQTVLAEGFSGLRSASEMSLALAPVDHLGQAVDYDIALHTSLFTGRQSKYYTALCCWDERLFGGTEAMADARAVHPVILLSRPGTLHTAVAGDVVSIAGDSDLMNRDTFDQALRSLEALTGPTLVLDIADLSFFDAYSASALMRLAADLVPPRRLEIRCRNSQRRLLHLLGSRSVHQLTIVTTRL
jgi:anti-anti-sigma regulatory factor